MLPAVELAAEGALLPVAPRAEVVLLAVARAEAALLAVALAAVCVARAAPAPF